MAFHVFQCNHSSMWGMYRIADLCSCTCTMYSQPCYPNWKILILIGYLFSLLVTLSPSTILSQMGYILTGSPYSQCQCVQIGENLWGVHVWQILSWMGNTLSWLKPISPNEDTNVPQSGTIFVTVTSLTMLSRLRDTRFLTITPFSQLEDTKLAPIRTHFVVLFIIIRTM